ncbi:hypothetical protein FDECE_1499 [Fusarium decemcellulare]|nr:hypothetical protein FDECE_1499 [Fusarium decemcellulare]
MKTKLLEQYPGIDPLSSNGLIGVPNGNEDNTSLRRSETSQQTVSDDADNDDLSSWNPSDIDDVEELSPTGNAVSYGYQGTPLQPRETEYRKAQKCVGATPYVRKHDEVVTQPAASTQNQLDTIHQAMATASFGKELELAARESEPQESSNLGLKGVHGQIIKDTPTARHRQNSVGSSSPAARPQTPTPSKQSPLSRACSSRGGPFSRFMETKKRSAMATNAHREHSIIEAALSHAAGRDYTLAEMSDLISGATPLYARDDTPAITLRKAIAHLDDFENQPLKTEGSDDEINMGFPEELCECLEECSGNDVPICPVAFHGQAPMPRGAASPSSTPRKRKDSGSAGALVGVWWFSAFSLFHCAGQELTQLLDNAFRGGWGTSRTSITTITRDGIRVCLESPVFSGHDEGWPSHQHLSDHTVARAKIPPTGRKRESFQQFLLRAEAINPNATDENELYQLMEESTELEELARGFRHASRAAELHQDQVLALYREWVKKPTGAQAEGMDDVDEAAVQAALEKACFPDPNPDSKQLFLQLRLFLAFAVAKCVPRSLGDNSISYQTLVAYRGAVRF